MGGDQLSPLQQVEDVLPALTGQHLTCVGQARVMASLRNNAILMIEKSSEGGEGAPRA